MLRDLVRLLRAVVLADRWAPWLRLMLTIVLLAPVIVLVAQLWPVK